MPGLLRECRKQGDTGLLHSQVLAVLQWQIEKYAVNRRQAQMTAAGDRILCQAERQRVSRKRLRCAPVDVA